MAFLMYIFLFFLQLLTGLALLRVICKQYSRTQQLSLGYLLGLAIYSIIPFFLELFHLPIRLSTIVFLGILLLFVLLPFARLAGSIPQMSGRFGRILSYWYAFPVLFLIIILLFLSAWRAFYFPPLAVDITSGAEALAEYAIREGRLVNSVFEVPQNGNSLKPPFLFSLQVIYKLAGFPFGQVWLPAMVLAFIVYLHNWLSSRLEFTLSLLLLLIFLCVPEAYAYTYSALYDYPNMIFFTVGLLLFQSYLERLHSGDFWLAAIFLMFATYIRPETILLLAFAIGLLLVVYGGRLSLGGRLRSLFLLMVMQAGIYMLSVSFYIHYLLPVSYGILDQVNPAVLDLRALWSKMVDVNRELIFSRYGLSVYSYFIYLFLIFLALDVILFRSITRRAGYYLCVLLAVYLFFPFLSHVLPGVSIDYTVKRAYFKLLPFMLLYLSESQILTRFSLYLSRCLAEKTT